MHIADRSHGNLGANGIVGGGIPLATGAALGAKLEGTDRVVVCFFGDGAANNGVFAESLNMAAVYRLPVIYLLENNCWAAATHVTETACTELSERARGYGLPGVSVYGNDAVAVYETVRDAVVRARAGEGPTLVEARTHRILGHHVNDAAEYMDIDEVNIWREHDPLSLIADRCRDIGIGQDEIAAIDREVADAIERAVVFAENSPEPAPGEFLAAIAEYDV